MRRVLVVDDDADFRAVLGEVLLGLGAASCVLAGSLAEVEDREAEALACELALLDVNLGLGEPTGLDVAEWLAEHGFRGETVFLTGHASALPRLLESAGLVPARVLEKPVPARVLGELVAEAR